ncbi:MAG TPA: hypothetical protein VNR18_13135 [Hyphomicrobiales bacterium]|nr:hypothetical protein [Hyphomicrobiales bacterium]
MRYLFPLALIAALLSPLGASAATNDCDRACLQELITGYMNAVVAGDTSAASLMPGYRQTENTIVKRVGNGVWEHVTGLRDGARYYLDPRTGEGLWFGVVQTDDRPEEVAMVRIKVLDRQIAEAEWFITAPMLGAMNGPAQPDGTGQLMANPGYLLESPPRIRDVPAAQRLSRASLLGISNSYFDGLTAGDGSLVLAHPDCFRAENGVLVTGRPLAEGRNDGYNGQTNCGSNFDNFNISLVGARRFPIVDEEQQVVVTSAIFMRNANGFQRRCVFLELFYVEDNLISEIYSVIYYPEPGEPAPNWEPYNGNWPLPADFGEAR